MRSLLTIPLLVLWAVPGASAQTVRCQLTPTQYAFRGVCLADPSAPRGERGLSAFWPESITVFMTAGPRDAPPWRGNMSLPSLELSFEVARETPTPDRARVVLRTGLFWRLVTEWREGEAGRVSLAFSLSDAPTATEDDIVILSTALGHLDSIAHWDREDDRDCANDAPGVESLFCVLSAAIEARMGRYHHRQPALELLRAVIVERWPDRMAGHPIMDFNNHPATTIDDLRAALQLALEAAGDQATSAPTLPDAREPHDAAPGLPNLASAHQHHRTRTR